MTQFYLSAAENAFKKVFKDFKDARVGTNQGFSCNAIRVDNGNKDAAENCFGTGVIATVVFGFGKVAFGQVKSGSLIAAIEMIL